MAGRTSKLSTMTPPTSKIRRRTWSLPVGSIRSGNPSRRGRALEIVARERCRAHALDLYHEQWPDRIVPLSWERQDEKRRVAEEVAPACSGSPRPKAASPDEGRPRCATGPMVPDRAVPRLSRLLAPGQPTAPRSVDSFPLARLRPRCGRPRVDRPLASLAGRPHDGAKPMERGACESAAQFDAEQQWTVIEVRVLAQGRAVQLAEHAVFE